VQVRVHENRSQQAWDAIAVGAERPMVHIGPRRAGQSLVGSAQQSVDLLGETHAEIRVQAWIHEDRRDQGHQLLVFVDAFLGFAGSFTGCSSTMALPSASLDGVRRL
jgi:hypothetical protein